MVKCKCCGKDISDYAVVCPNCGVRINLSNGASEDIKVCSSIKPDRAKASNVILGILVVILIVSGFIFACAQSAYNSAIGKSPVGMGAILFEEYIVSGPIKPIIIARTFSGLVMIVCLSVMAVYAMRKFHLKRTKSNH